MATTPQTKPLIHILDEELRYSTRDNLKGYTITGQGKIYDPEGNEMTPRLYRGKPTVSVGGLLIFLDYAVCKLFCDGWKSGLAIGYRDGDKTNVDANNLYWRPRLLPCKKAEEEPTEGQEQEQPAEETQQTAQEPEERWIRRYDKATCKLIAEYTSYGEAVRAIQEENPNTAPTTIRPKVRQALRYGYTAYGCLWRASSPCMLGRGVSRGKHQVMTEPPTTSYERPEGWIRGYTLDGKLVKEYHDLDECLADLSQQSEQKPAHIAASIRLNVEGKVRTFLGLRWEVSDPQLLKSKWGQLCEHPRNAANAPQTAKEGEGDNLYHPTPESPSEGTGEGYKWIRRYNGDLVVAEYHSLEEAVEAMSGATVLTPIQIATRIRQAVRQNHHRTRYLGCAWRASGDDVLQWRNGEPPRQLAPQPTESVKPMEPQPTERVEEVRTEKPQPAPQPTQPTEQTDTPSKPSPSLHQPYEVEVETSGDVEVEVGGVTVKVSVTDKSRVRICVRSHVRE